MIDTSEIFTTENKVISTHAIESKNNDGFLVRQSISKIIKLTRKVSTKYKHVEVIKGKY